MAPWNSEVFVNTSGTFCEPLPCCGIECCRSSFEESSICRSAGSYGITTSDVQRAKLMYSAVFLSLLSVALTIPSIFGGSDNDAWLRHTSWDVGKTKQLSASDGDVLLTVEVFAGLQLYVQRDSYENQTSGESTVQDTVVSYSDSSCVDSFCQSCHDSTNFVMFMALLTLLAAVACTYMELARSSPRGDLNCLKVSSTSFVVIGTFCGILSLVVHQDQCRSSLPTSWTVEGEEHDMSWHQGGSYNCFVAALVLNVLVFVAHVLLPTPPEKWAPHETDWHATCQLKSVAKKAREARRVSGVTINSAPELEEVARDAAEKSQSDPDVDLAAKKCPAWRSNPLASVSLSPIQLGPDRNQAEKKNINPMVELPAIRSGQMEEEASGHITFQEGKPSMGGNGDCGDGDDLTVCVEAEDDRVDGNVD